MRRAARWFERLADGRVAVYNEPTAAQASSVSLVGPDDLAFYRSNFELRQVWAVDTQAETVE